MSLTSASGVGCPSKKIIKGRERRLGGEGYLS